MNMRAKQKIKKKEKEKGMQMDILTQKRIPVH
jgi:hypothetical protein